MTFFLPIAADIPLYADKLLLDIDWLTNSILVSLIVVGMQAEEGGVLYRIADLSNVWLIADAPEMTLPPTFIQRERDSGFEFCPFGRVGQRGLARSFAGCAASGPVAG